MTRVKNASKVLKAYASFSFGMPVSSEHFAALLPQSHQGQLEASPCEAVFGGILWDPEGHSNKRAEEDEDLGTRPIQ